MKPETLKQLLLKEEIDCWITNQFGDCLFNEDRRWFVQSTGETIQYENEKKAIAIFYDITKQKIEE